MSVWEEAHKRIEEDVNAVLGRAHASTAGLVDDLLKTLGLGVELSSEPVATGDAVTYTIYSPGPVMYRITGSDRKGAYRR